MKKKLGLQFLVISLIMLLLAFGMSVIYAAQGKAIIFIGISKNIINPLILGILILTIVKVDIDILRY